MNFGSKKVFMYAEPEFEVVSDEEYEHGMSVSESDSDEDDDLAEHRNKAGDGPSGSDAVPPPQPTPSGSGPPPPPPAPKPPKTGFLAGLFGSKTPKAPKPPKLNIQAKKKVGRWRNADMVDSAALGEKTRESAKQGQRHRRADTNIISIDFRKIIAPSNMHTGDPVHCTSCDVILSSISKITASEDKKVISWLKCYWSRNVQE